MYMETEKKMYVTPTIKVRNYGLDGDLCLGIGEGSTHDAFAKGNNADFYYEDDASTGEVKNVWSE